MPGTAGLIDSRLAELGLEIPEIKAPLAAYAPHVRTGNLLFVSGQVSLGPDGLVAGQLTAADNEGGAGLDRAVGAARLCALNLIAAVRDATGDLDRVVRVVKLTGFVNGTAEFTRHPKVIDGCSELLGAVFGDAGKHARSAVGASCLPLNATVEVEGVFEIAG